MGSISITNIASTFFWRIRPDIDLRYHFTVAPTSEPDIGPIYPYIGPISRRLQIAPMESLSPTPYRPNRSYYIGQKYYRYNELLYI